MTTRVAKLMLSLGAVSVTLVAFHWKVFELDRYFVPKELVLHIVGFAVAIILVTERRTLRPDAADMLLALFLAISGVSALFATNHWLAQRALAVSVSSALVFWGARRIGASGSHTLLLWTAAGATVLAAITSLLQAYGVDSEWFTLNRAPGGTLGNRNFVAHLIAIGLPAVVWCTLTARKPVFALAGSIGVGLMGSALVLSRSRAAWLAVAATLIVGGALLFIGRRY